MSQNEKSTVKIAAIQLSVTDDKTKKERMRDVKSIFQEMESIEKKPDLILLPEIWGCGFFDFDHYTECAEERKGETFQLLSTWAAKLQSVIVGGSIVEISGDTLFNRLLCIERDGTLKATYRKRHLFGFQSKEQQILTKGESAVVADTQFGKIGFSTCYDLRFPEHYREMIDQGAELFVVVSAWPEARLDHWRLFNQVRAVENQCWLVSCNCAGLQCGNRYAGHSMAVSPSGVIAAEAGGKACVQWIDIDMKEVERARNAFPALRDR